VDRVCGTIRQELDAVRLDILARWYFSIQEGAGHANLVLSSWKQQLQSRLDSLRSNLDNLPVEAGMLIAQLPRT